MKPVLTIVGKTNDVTTMSCTCTCAQLTRNNHTPTPEDLEIIRDGIKQSLRIDRSITIKFKSKKISFGDDRFSAKIIGLVGASVLVIVICFIVMLDLVPGYEEKSKRRSNMRHTRITPHTL